MASVKNSSWGNIEIKYAKKPSQASRDSLHNAGYHWVGVDHVWVAKPTKKAVARAQMVQKNFKPKAR